MTKQTTFVVIGALRVNIDDEYFRQTADTIHPNILLNKISISDTEAPFLDLILSLFQDIILLKFMTNGTNLVLIL